MPWIIAGVGGGVALVTALVVIFLTSGGGTSTRMAAADEKQAKPVPIVAEKTQPAPVAQAALETLSQQQLIAQPVEIPAGAVPKEIDPQSTRHVKKATAYLRVKFSDGREVQGSGFFAAERGVVFTNAHVLGMLNPSSPLPAKVDIVTDSGEQAETSRQGRVLGVDRENDLAVLRVEGDVASLPDPLPVDTTRNLTELQNVYIFGFPFGTSLGKNITVSASSISSLRKEADGTVYQVQVNGGMNSGNSGGPVVDARGVVVGVAVAIIQGTQINFAVPGERVLELLRGRVATVTLGEAYLKDARAKVPIELTCLDPMNRFHDIKIDVWAGNHGPVRSLSLQQPAPLPGDGPRQTTLLPYKDNKALAEIELPAAGSLQTFWIQPVVTDKAGVKHWGTATPYKMADFAPLELHPVVLQHQFEGQGERTVKFGNVYKQITSKGGKQTALAVNLEMEAVETAQKEPRGGQFRLFAVKTNMSVDVDGKPSAENPQLQALTLLNGKTFSFITNPSGYMLVRSVPTFRSLRNANLTLDFANLTMDFSNAFEMTLLSLPNRSVEPKETWDARVPFILNGLGKRKDVVDMALKCTLEGTRTVRGQNEAVISLRGDILRRTGPRRFAGKVSGKAYFLVDKGFISQVRLKKEAAGLDDSHYVEVNLTRTFGNTTGVTPPPLAPFTPLPNLAKGRVVSAPTQINAVEKAEGTIATVIPGDTFAFLKQAVKDGRTRDVDIKGFTVAPNTFREVPANGGILIGFQVGYRELFGKQVIDALSPIFKTAQGEKTGTWIGKVPAQPFPVKAKPGYAVAAITIATDVRINGFSLRFMKLAKNGLDVDDIYESPWIGTNTDDPTVIGGIGAVALGVCGHINNEASPCSLGLIMSLLPQESPATLANDKARPTPAPMDTGEKTVGATAKDATGDLFTSLKQAIKEKRTIDVNVRGFTLTKNTYRQMSADGGVLIGFQVGFRNFFGKPVIDALRPIYTTSTGEKKGTWIGRIPAKPFLVKAKAGYAVAAINISTGLGINGFSLKFLKIAKDRLDEDENYESRWVATKADAPTLIGGAGVASVGVCGHLSNEGSPCSLGLIMPLVPETAGAAGR